MGNKGAMNKEEMRYYHKLKKSIRYTEGMLHDDAISQEFKDNLKVILKASKLTLMRFRSYMYSSETNGIWS